MAVRRKPSKRSDHGLRLIAATARSERVPKIRGWALFIGSREKEAGENLIKADFFKSLVYRFRRFRTIRVDTAPRMKEEPPSS